MVPIELLNATVLFLGISLAATLIGRMLLRTIKIPTKRPLRGVEERIRAEAMAAVAAAVCRRTAKEAAASRAGDASAQDPNTALVRTVFPCGELRRAANAAAWRAPLRAAGFTTPELLTSLAVLAILTGVSVPAFTGLMLDTQTKTAAVDVYTTMVYARSEAIKRNANVDIIPVGGNWKNGWSVQAGATVLKTVTPATKGLDDITAPATITYRYDGRLTDPGTITYVLNVTGNPNVTPRRVIVDTSGRPSIRLGLS